MKLEQRFSAGLAIVHNKRLLLLHTTGRGSTHSSGIPKGGLEDGEANLEAAIRETSEECGIDVPVKMIDKNPHTFVVTSKKHGYIKNVSYFIVEVDDLSEIGLKSMDIPKRQLQLKEVDAAGFFEYKDAVKLIMTSQAPVITTLLNKGLI